MWKSEQTGEVFVVTSLYRDVLASFAMLRAIHSATNENNKRAKVMRIVGGGECIVGFSIAEQVSTKSCRFPKELISCASSGAS